MIEFCSPSKIGPGKIAILLRKSYEALSKRQGFDWEMFARAFDEFDQQIFSNEGVMKCTFVTVVDGVPIGVGSFDPRGKPEYGDIGHNCIIPEYQGRGYGQQQIREILLRIKEGGIRKARVSTSLDPFFSSARKMYEQCGFIQTRTFISKSYPKWEMVEYEREMSSYEKRKTFEERKN